MSEDRNEAEDVVDAFIEACPVPTPADVAAWTKAHPQFAQPIKEAAAEALAHRLLTGGDDASGPSDKEVDAHFRLALNAAGLERPDMSVPELIDNSGHDLPAVARSLDIGVDVLAALEEGMVSTPPPKRFIAAFANVVMMPRSTVARSIEVSRERPEVAMAAKMAGTGALTPRSWAEVVQASAMSAERKDFWLSDV